MAEQVKVKLKKDKRGFPTSDRRPKFHCCKNCEHIIVHIELPTFDDDYEPDNKEIADMMRKTAEALKVSNDSDFFCVYLPEWKELYHIDRHYCSQFLLRPNWKQGYQDIERTWETVDLVYETRWDCTDVPEEVRQVAA